MPRVFTDEWRKKISDAAKARAATPEGKALLDAMQAARPTVVSEETRAKISEAGMGRVQSKETKAKRAESRVGYQHSDETKAKIGHANAGRVMSAESSEKKSLATKGRKQSPEHIAARTAARQAKGTWFTITDIGERISEGKKDAFAEMTEEEKLPFQERARKLGEDRRFLPDKNCEYCGALIGGSNKRQPQRRFCSRPCRNKVIKGYTNGYVKKGAERQCPVDGTIFWVKQSQLREVNYCSHRCRAMVRIGEKNPNWRDGSTPKNAKIRASRPYREWRMAVLTRDNFLCRHCGADTDLHAHHIELFSEVELKRFDVENGLTLCQACHEAVHGYKIRPPRRNTVNQK